MKRFFLWGGMAIVLLLIVVVVSRGGGEKMVLEQAPPIAAADHVYGPRDAKVVLVEYSDFQCPACRNYTPVVAQIEEEFKNDVAVVYRHFPLRAVHKHAELAARAAQAAAGQGKFFEMHDLLFTEQASWSTEMDPTDAFLRMAGQIGLDVDAFKAAMKSKEVKAAVQANVDEGESLGITSTPSFFLNGVFVQKPDGYALVETVRKAVEASRSAEVPVTP
jgi:protein-disulfide isomerase